MDTANLNGGEFYSTKRVRAWSESRNLPNVEGAVPGVVLLYSDGYRSWCPSSVFERDYQPVVAMSFGHALNALKRGEKVTRPSFEGRFVYWKTDGDSPLLGIGDGEFFAWPWSPDQGDMFANDWQIVEGE